MRRTSPDRSNSCTVCSNSYTFDLIVAFFFIVNKENEDNE